MAPFRLGLVGAGRMGRTHLRALADSERVAVTAIADTSAAARSAVEVPGVTLHVSVASMLDAAAIDGVLVVAPTDQHGAIIAEVAERGLPVLCEKPCGLTAAAARASARTAAAAGVRLQVAYWRRFVPGLRRLHDRITAGEFGTVHLVTCYQWDEQPPPAAFRAHSGGIAIDMGVHEFDQLRWLTGQDISGLAVVTSGQAPDGIADVDGAQVIATLSGGGCGFISLGRFYPAGDAVLGRGVRHPGQRTLRRHRPGRGRAGAARRAAPPGRELRRVRARGAVRGGHRRRRGRGADRRRAGDRGDTGAVGVPSGKAVTVRGRPASQRQ